MLIIKEGIDISTRDEHSSKASSSIEITDEGIDICVNEEQPLKAE